MTNRSLFPKSVAVLLLLSSWNAGAQEEANRNAGSTTPRMIQSSEAVKAPSVIPTPQETYWGNGSFNIGANGRYSFSVELDDSARSAALIPEDFARRVEKLFSVSPEKLAGGTRFIFTLNAAGIPGEGPGITGSLSHIGPEGYVIKTIASDASGNRVYIAGNSEQALWHGMATAVQLICSQGGGLTFPQVEIIDYPAMQDRALLVDMGGQGFMVGPSRWDFSRWKEFVDWMVDQKLNSLWLEFIGSGRLMGNLNMQAGEWIGFPLTLQSYPQLVGKDRPIHRWDDKQGKVVADTYTIPNVQQDFVGQLIDYAQARGVHCQLLIGYDYFANQLPVVLGLPANDPANPKANAVYDAILKEIVQRYKNASGVVLCTIESKDVTPEMVGHIIRRTNDAYKIVRDINPKMEVGLLADYLEWRPLGELESLKQGIPADVSLAYSPHREPQQKSWKRVFDNVWRYVNYTQYAWDHVAYIFPDKIRDEILGSYADGYRKIVSQAWYFDVFALNYTAMAEYSWNLTPGSFDDFWNEALDREFGRPARDLMRTALEHTRFDLRFDIIGRMILRDQIDSPFSFWDMYVLTNFDGLKASMLDDLENDATQSLTAAQAALPLVPAQARGDVEIVIISAQRRLYLATSAKHALKALDLQKAGDLPGARAEIGKCLADAAKLQDAAVQLGIEFPLAVHDAKIVQRYQKIAASLQPAVSKE